MPQYHFVEQRGAFADSVIEAPDLTQACQAYQQLLASGSRAPIYCVDDRDGPLISIACDGNEIPPAQWPAAFRLDHDQTLQVLRPTYEQLKQFADDVVSILYRNLDTGRLDGEDTLPQKSCADALEALESLVGDDATYGLRVWFADPEGNPADGD